MCDSVAHFTNKNFLSSISSSHGLRGNSYGNALRSVTLSVTNCIPTQSIGTRKNIQQIIDAYKARETVDKYAYLATFEEIKENDFNLNIPRYVDTFEEEQELDLVAIRTERLGLQLQLSELEVEMAGYLRELGYGA